MILTALLASTAISLVGQQAKPISCPVMGGPVAKGSKVTEYNGASFSYCCAGCDSAFAQDPKGAIEKAAKSGNTVGVFLFDPVSKKPIKADDAKGGFSDYKGIRFYFDSEADKKAFDKTPAKFGMLPKKEVMVCPVSKEAVASYDKAGGYADLDGVRYYFCCPNCAGGFANDPAKFAEGVKDKIKAPATVDPAKDGGK